mgnify:CR=1 FL=1
MASTRGAAEPASALAASLARPLPLRAWGALPTWGSMIYVHQEFNIKKAVHDTTTKTKTKKGHQPYRPPTGPLLHETTAWRVPFVLPTLLVLLLLLMVYDR